MVGQALCTQSLSPCGALWTHFISENTEAKRFAYSMSYMEYELKPRLCHCANLDYVHICPSVLNYLQSVLTIQGDWAYPSTPLLVPNLPPAPQESSYTQEARGYSDLKPCESGLLLLCLHLPTPLSLPLLRHVELFTVVKQAPDSVSLFTIFHLPGLPYAPHLPYPWGCVHCHSKHPPLLISLPKYCLHYCDS